MKTPSPTTTSPSSVSDQDIRAWDDLVHGIASRLAGRRGAELDDLIQEGRIAVWQSLLRGVNPGTVIENRMRDYVRWVGRRNEAVPYGAALPVEAGGEG